MSMVLTSTPLWRCTTERNRIIPTISIGCFDVGRVNVSAVDTGLPAGSTPRGPGGRAGCSRPDAGSGPSPALNLSSPRGWGSTGRGLCVLHEGPTYRECTRPSSSRSPPSCRLGQAPIRAAASSRASPRRGGEQRPSGPVHLHRYLGAPRHPAHGRGLRSGCPTGGLRRQGIRSFQVIRRLAGLRGRYSQRPESQARTSAQVSRSRTTSRVVGRAATWSAPRTRRTAVSRRGVPPGATAAASARRR